MGRGDPRDRRMPRFMDTRGEALQELEKVFQMIQEEYTQSGPLPVDRTELLVDAWREGAMRTTAGFLLLLSVLACASPPPKVASAPAAALPPTLPVARTVNVTENIFAMNVSDPYRWMEGNENAELTSWLRAQGAYTSAWLARIPARDAMLRRVRELGLGTSTSSGVQLAGSRMFYRHIEAGQQLPKLMVREANSPERLLVDPATLGSGGSHASLNASAPSPDGALVAYDLGLGGGEVSSIHVIDVVSGKELPDAVDRVWGEFPASWLPDRSGFFYSQMAPPVKDVDPMLNMTVRLHILGQPAANDRMILTGTSSAMPLAPEEFPYVGVDPESQWMIAIAGGARNEARIGIAPLSALDRTGAGGTPWRKVADFSDSIEDVAAHGDRLYMMTFKGASNRKIVSVPLTAPDLSAAKIEIPESADATLVRFGAARDALYIETMTNGRARMLRMTWGGAAEPIAVPFDGWIDEIATDPRAPGAMIRIQTGTRPPAVFRYDVAGRSFVPTGITTTTNADYSHTTVEEVEATSSDGTKVPLSIVHRADLTLDGSNPAIEIGYGGYGISLTPKFDPGLLAWIERGGVFAVCHVRGGGEKGYKWQVAGTHEHKMNGVHDFEACAQYLIDHRLTSASRLAGLAGSMGGILIGRAITERPDLYSAANVAVGVVNPLRILAAENGANQKAELGDPETEGGFRSIYEMDPYQHVKPGTAYPAVIYTVGLNDRRVAPWMTAKMAARMQAATTSGKPVLIRVESDAGHGIGSTRDQALAERADVFSFFLAAAGDPAFQPR